MSEVLVVIDHVDGEVKKPTYELLTIARRLGEPSAVFFGSPDKVDAVAEKVKKYGAEKVYVIDDAEIKGYLVAPKAEALQQLAEKTPARPRSCCPRRSRARRSRPAWRSSSSSGLITDAVDVQEGPVTTQSVFAGNFTVTGEGHPGHPDHHGQAQLGRSRGGRGRRRGRGVRA